MTLRAAVFDLDGTLVESDEDLRQALNATLAELGRPPYSRAEVRRMVGGGVGALLAKALGDSALVASAQRRFLIHYERGLLDTTRPYPGIRALLEALRSAGIPALVATNKPAHFTRRVITGLGLDQVGLVAWASSDEVERPKPDPGVLALALRKGGLAPAPAEVAYVGDMAVDVAAGRAFGAYVVGVAWGFDPKGLAEAEPDAIAPDAEALLQVLLSGEGGKKAGQAPAISRKGGLPDDP